MSTSSPGDTPANRSQRQAKGKAKKTRGISGLTSSTPFAQYDPDTHSWKTCEATLLSDSETFSPTLPPAGILRNGRLFQRPRLAPRTVATASSSWPTPTASDHIERKSTQQKEGSRHSLTLPDAVKRWPTPTTQEIEHPNATWNENGRRVSSSGTTHSMGLADAVRLWPTPQVDDSKNVNPSPKRRKTLVSEVMKSEQWPTPTASSWGSTGHRAMLQAKVDNGTISEADKKQMTSGNGGKLNPEWVGWLMGFPPGWINLEASETPSSLKSPNSSEG